MPASGFPWLASAPRRRASDGANAERRAAMYRAELEERAALYARLGYPAKRAVARLKANIAWDFELAPRQRPSGLTDRDISELVKAVYARR